VAQDHEDEGLSWLSVDRHLSSHRSLQFSGTWNVWKLVDLWASSPIMGKFGLSHETSDIDHNWNHNMNHEVTSSIAIIWQIYQDNIAYLAWSKRETIPLSPFEWLGF
jgi:hypothetical protein